MPTESKIGSETGVVDVRFEQRMRIARWRP
jgi:hypothetical protein